MKSVRCEDCKKMISGSFLTKKTACQCWRLRTEKGRLGERTNFDILLKTMLAFGRGRGKSSATARECLTEIYGHNLTKKLLYDYEDIVCKLCGSVPEENQREGTMDVITRCSTTGCRQNENWVEPEDWNNREG